MSQCNIRNWAVSLSTEHSTCCYRCQSVLAFTIIKSTVAYRVRFPSAPPRLGCLLTCGVRLRVASPSKCNVQQLARRHKKSHLLLLPVVALSIGEGGSMSKWLNLLPTTATGRIISGFQSLSRRTTAIQTPINTPKTNAAIMLGYLGNQGNARGSRSTPSCADSQGL